MGKYVMEYHTKWGYVMEYNKIKGGYKCLYVTRIGGKHRLWFLWTIFFSLEFTLHACLINIVYLHFSHVF